VLASSFVNDANKAAQEYAQEGLKQGQKLGEQAFEIGKDKGSTMIVSIRRINFLFFLFSANEALKATLEAGAAGLDKARQLRMYSIFIFN